MPKPLVDRVESVLKVQMAKEQAEARALLEGKPTKKKPGRKRKGK